MAIYPSEAAGWSALEKTLTGKYGNSSIIDTMNAFTPCCAKGNDPVSYANMLANAIGAPVSSKISDLTSGQLMTVEYNIAKQEGFLSSSGQISYTAPR
jgi:hypothetical protein